MHFSALHRPYYCLVQTDKCFLILSITKTLENYCINGIYLTHLTSVDKFIGDL